MRHNVAWLIYFDVLVHFVENYDEICLLYAVSF